MSQSEHEFEMPSELQRPPPRAIRRKDGMLGGCGLIFIRLFILPHMIAGVIVLLLVPLTLAEVFFGEVQQGQIIDKWTTKGKKTYYHIKFAYDADGSQRTGERTCSQAQYEAMGDLKRKQPPPSIEIRGLHVLGHFYHEDLLPGESRWGKVVPFLVFALFWNGLLYVFVHMAWIAPLQEKRLYRRGTPVPGRITGKHTRQGKSVSYYLEYEFIQPRFGLLKKHQSVNGNQYYHQANAGQLVTVLCWPHKKRPALIYEFGNFVCV